MNLLWNWFMVLLDAPTISYLVAFGLLLVVDYMIYTPMSWNNRAWNEGNDTDFRLDVAMANTGAVIVFPIIGFVIQFFI